MILRKKSLHLSPGVLFSNLATWYNMHQGKETKKKPKTISKCVDGSKSQANQYHKIPFLKVPIFQGNTLNGDNFIKDINRAFRSVAMVRYLKLKSYCNNNPCWSGAFPSRIRESVAKNDILMF